MSKIVLIVLFITGNSPSGDTVIAISSSDPNIEKYLTVNFSNNSENVEEPNFNRSPSDTFHRTFSTALAGTNTSSGRNFGSFNPFLLPFLNFPLNLEGLGLNIRPGWVQGVESYEPNYNGNGEIKTMTAINDNGHVYGKVKTVTFDNAKSNQ